MKHLFVVIVIMPFYLQAQIVEQKGYVREISYSKEAKDTPIEGVRVKVETEERSDANGNVNLKITKTDNNTFVFNDIHKIGYRLISPSRDSIYNKRYPLNEAVTVEVILANEALLRKEANTIAEKRYQQLEKELENREETIEQKDKALAELKETDIRYRQIVKERDSLQQKLDIFYTQYTEAWNKIREEAEKLAQIDYKTLDSLSLLNLELKKAGKWQEIVEVNKKSAAEREKELQMLKKVQESVEDAIQAKVQQLGNDYLNTANGFKLGFEIDSALVYFKKRVDLDSTSYSYLFDYASLLQDSKRFYEAQTWYLKTYQYAQTKEKKASTLNNLGLLYNELQDYTNAKSAYMEALEISRELTKKYSKNYNSYVAMTLNNMGNLYSDLQDYTNAKNAYLEALEIKRELAKKHPESYISDVATTINNLGNLYSDLQDYTNAKSAYLEALEIRSELAKKYPESYNSDVAMTLNNLGGLFYYLQDYTNAKSAYMEALEIKRELAKKYPESYISDVATIINNLGSLYRELQDYTNAKSAYMEALEISKELAKKYPESYNSDVANTINNMGSLYRELQDYTNAKSAYMEALEIRRELAKKYPESYNSDVANTINSLGNLYIELQDYANAKKAYMEALEISKELAKKYPESYNSDVATTLNNLGTLYSNLQDYANAKKAYMEALEIRRELAKKYPESYNSDVAMTLNNQGSLYRVLQDYSNAKKAYMEALEIKRELAKKYPKRYVSDVGNTLNNLGNLYSDLQDYTNAKSAYLEALEIRRELAKKYPESYNSDVAMTLNNMGSLYRVLQDYSNTKKAYLEALEIRRELAKKYPESYNSDVANTLNSLGNLYSDLQDYTNAKSAYLEALETYRELVKNQPKNPAYLLEVARININIGKLLIKQNKKAEAIEYYQLAVNILHNLHVITGNNDYKNYADYYTNIIADFNKTNTDHRIAEQLELIKRYKLEEQTDSIAYLRASAYGNLSWYYLFSQEFVKAEEAARKSLAFGKETEWVNTNLAHALLFQGRFEEAKEIYQTFKDKSYRQDKSKTYKDFFLQDLKELEEAGITHPDMEKIRTLLKN
ncbi:tetratricopeptide repeat protein [Maribellus comscasis]|uniref:Tetratricopeptide repeat protein n=1 Tax=Maribellus comscasis TaxID=2681766 RepID=A0A6I6KAR3_9BACT|nr:tetratricopeptide repeat protein [Maribellus comscasis]QGY47284.1 tetratricopeptide repeat protein [Maribellus comscasis]